MTEYNEHCVAGALCEDAAARSWPEPDAAVQGASGLEIVLMVAVVWTALSIIATGAYVVLRQFWPPADKSGGAA